MLQEGRVEKGGCLVNLKRPKETLPRRPLISDRENGKQWIP